MEKQTNADKIVIDNQNKNTINIGGNTVIKEITLGDGADTIYAGENSQNITINKINFWSGRRHIKYRKYGNNKSF